VGWSAAGSLDWNGFRARLPDQMNRYQQLGIHAHTDQPPAVPSDATRLRRSSHQLQSCTNKILLSLEDDAPLSGNRAVFLVDIMNPCWIYQGADLSHVTGVAAAVGQLPFEFQVGADVYVPQFSRPRTPSGELEIRLDSCDGELLAGLSLEPALANDAVTELPAAKIAPREGKHDLCLKFTQWTPDPFWVIDWVQLLE
jgi:hexosaminidase